jgi:hypothetical protein
MPLPVPNLDDRQFDQLVTEARALIPRNLPAWTDFNNSDPGITLLEVFAFLIEAAIYQTNRVPERTLERFAKLVNVERASDEPIERTMRRAIEGLSAKSRAITREEFEMLARQAAPNDVARVKTITELVPNTNSQTVKVVIVPNQGNEPKPIPTPELRQTVFKFLRERSLITTRLKVVAPDYIPLRIDMVVIASSSIDKNALSLKVKTALGWFLNPLTGGTDGKGWEFGRAVFRSELFAVIEGVAGVDHVGQLRMNEPAVDKIPLGPLSLVTLTEVNVTVRDPE